MRETIKRANCLGCTTYVTLFWNFKIGGPAHFTGGSAAPHQVQSKVKMTFARLLTLHTKFQGGPHCQVVNYNCTERQRKEKGWWMDPVESPRLSFKIQFVPSSVWSNLAIFVCFHFVKG
jgi:hypothetical protein